jgi:UDP-glucose 4-epimerase
MRCLITGGAGFIGVALANQLTEMGHQVRVLDDLSAGDSSRLDARVVFTRGDTRDIPKLWTLLRGVDCVYHLAARVYVQESILYPVEYNDVNVGGTVSLMTAVRDARVKRVILASSGAAYGDQSLQPVKENASLRPPNPYAVSKMAAEGYAQALGKLYGIETVILRIFNVYGPGQAIPPSHPPVIPKLLKQALTGGSLVIYGQGAQTRDFVYISDVVQALISAGLTTDLDGLIANVGSGVEMSINQIVDVIEEVLGKKAYRLYSSAESGGISRLVADISLARQKLGFKPKMDLRKGLQALLAEDKQFAR